MNFDFSKELIVIRPYTDNWGQHRFKMPASSSAEANDGTIPFGKTIAAASGAGWSLLTKCHN